MIYKEKYLNYIKELNTKGLVDVNFFVTEKAKGKSEEEIYAELCRMNDAPDLEDKEVLGERSPV